MYIYIIHILYIVLCVHHHISNLLSSPFISPLPSFSSPHTPFPLLITINVLFLVFQHLVGQSDVLKIYHIFSLRSLKFSFSIFFKVYLLLKVLQMAPPFFSSLIPSTPHPPFPGNFSSGNNSFSSNILKK